MAQVSQDTAYRIINKIIPVWRDLLFAPYNDDPRLHFDLTDETLPPLNTITRAGVNHNAGRMNNLFSFDNIIALQGTECVTEGFGTNNFKATATDKVVDDLSGQKTVIATIEWEETAPGVWQCREQLYDIVEYTVGEGITAYENVVAQTRLATLTKDGNEWHWEVT